MEKIKGIEMPAAVNYDVEPAWALEEKDCVVLTAYNNTREKKKEREEEIK